MKGVLNSMAELIESMIEIFSNGIEIFLKFLKEIK